MKNQYMLFICLLLLSCSTPTRRQLTSDEIKNHQFTKDSKMSFDV